MIIYQRMQQVLYVQTNPYDVPQKVACVRWCPIVD